MVKNYYQKYRYSGLNWLGDIPVHWQTKRAKWVFREVDFRSGTGNEELLSVSEHFGVIKRKNANVNMFQAASYVGYKLCNPGDLVINSLWAWSRGLGFSKYHGIVSTAYGVYRPNPNEVGDYQYFHYLLRTKQYVGQYAIKSKGIWISRLQLSDRSFLDTPILLPPKEEQTAIARFLDYKLSKINRFIRKKKQLIKLLNEQKAAIINQAVTKGLNPNADMKNSGIEWLGEIPAHWEVRKLKYVANFQSGEMITSESIEQTGEYPVFGGGGFRGYTNAYTNDGKHVLIGRQGALCGNIKYAEGKFWASEHAIVTYPKIQIKTFFLGEILRMANLGSLSQTAAQPGISIGQIKLVKIPIPPLPEQQQIVAHIETETALLTTAISTIEKELTLVEEYKTALIAEAVTGKIDVRGYAVPETDMEADSYEEIEEVLSMAAEDAAEYQTEETE